MFYCPPSLFPSFIFILSEPISFLPLFLFLQDYLSPKCFFAQRRRWHPTAVLLPGKSHGQRSLVGCSPWGREESETTERLHFHFSLSCIGEGNGNSLQCSCLENPRDGGAWWAAIYGVTQSQTRLTWLSSSSFFFGEHFWVGHFKIFKPLLILLTKLLLFLCFWSFGHEESGILASQPGIESASPALEGDVLTAGPPGKSHSNIFEQSCSALTLLVSKCGQALHNMKLLLDRMTISASQQVSWETKSWPTYLLNGSLSFQLTLGAEWIKNKLV